MVLCYKNVGIYYVAIDLKSWLSLIRSLHYITFRQRCMKQSTTTILKRNLRYAICLLVMNAKPDYQALIESTKEWLRYAEAVYC
jgi:hypothetical protein